MPGELKATFAALPRTTRGQTLIITGKDDKKTMLYCHGNSVFIRNIDDPSICDVYTEHTKETTVAKYSPSGYYIASADVTGKIRIWDTVNLEHILKNEFQPFAGLVKDLDWTADSQRMVAGGQGREKFCHAFSADTGTSVGEMLGHSKQVNAVAMRKDRPFRIATASEDQSCCFYHGPPFKLNKQIEDHKNFANAIDYASDGSKFVSGGADGRAYLYEGKTGDKLQELGDPAHKGGIYGVRFSPNSQEILSVSGDKTAKIWNAETGEKVCEFVMGTAVPDMQLGCAWIGENLITVSLSGNINYLDRNNPTYPMRVIKGHNKPITSLIAADDTLYSSDADGKICVWNANNGTCSEVSGKGHVSQVQDMSLNAGTLVTCGLDDKVRTIDAQSQSYSEVQVEMSSQPQAVDARGDYTVVACNNEIVVLQNGRLLFTQKADYSPSCVAINPSQSEIAVGGGKDMKVHIYSLNGGTLEETQLLQQTGEITCLSFSPDGAYLAAGDSNRKLALYECPSYNVLVGANWTGHTAKIMCLAWSPDSQYIATGALDTHIKIWTVGEISKHMTIERAHKMSAVSALSWRGNNELVSAGHDACIKLWNISF